MSVHIHTDKNDIDALVSRLQTLLPLTIAYDSIAMQVTLSSSDPFSISGTLLELLGMQPAENVQTLTTQYTVDLTGCQSLYMMVNGPASGNLDTRSAANASAMCRIPVEGQAGSIINWTNVSPIAGLWLPEGELTNMHVLLEDDKRRPLQNTLYWEATLQVQYVPNGKQRWTYSRSASLKRANEDEIMLE